MKPLGPIPPYFNAMGGVLAVAGRPVTEWAGEAGDTPLFLYAKDIVAARIADLRAAMPERLALHYAVKANPFGPLLAFMGGLVDGFDIASGGELELVRAAGIDLANVSFAGPGKRDSELSAAIAAGVTINLESEGEAERALAAGQRLGIAPHLAVRVNPDFDLKGSGMKMGGGAKPFGVDAARAPALVQRVIASGARFEGLHIFAGSQALDAAAIADTQAQTLELAARIAADAGTAVPRCNLGGGFGIPYFHGDTPLDIALVGKRLAESFAALPDALQDTAFCIELGRWLVGEAGVYIARVIDRKESHGEVFLVTDGGLHHQLAASGNFGTVVRRNYPSAIATRFDAGAEEEASIVGCLCTPLDRLADKGSFPKAQAGDLVVIFCAGAYGAAASPARFLGQGEALELLV